MLVQLSEFSPIVEKITGLCKPAWDILSRKPRIVTFVFDTDPPVYCIGELLIPKIFVKEIRQ